MGLFDFLKPKSASTGQFVNANLVEDNTNKRVQGALKILEQLRAYNITNDKYLQLEYFFYTNDEEKARNLAEEIGKLNYSVKHGAVPGKKSLFVITGWTTRIKMDESTITDWVKEMCAHGYKYDCLFDGWGTDPNQT